MNIADVVSTLVEGLVVGLPDDYQVYDHNPVVVTAPAVIVAPSAATYDEDFDDSWTLPIGIVVLLPQSSDTAEVQRRLWAHAQPTGELSIRSIVDGLDLEDVAGVDDWHVTGYEAPGRYEIGQTEYAGVQVNLEVMS